MKITFAKERERMEFSSPLGQCPVRPVPATIGVVFQGEKVLLVRRANPPDAGRWGLPGGKINHGESIAQAAVREVLEETGVHTVAGPVFTAVDCFDMRQGRLHQHFILIAVLCRYISGIPAAADDALDARWFTKEERERADLALSMDVLKVIALAETLSAEIITPLG